MASTNPVVSSGSSTAPVSDRPANRVLPDGQQSPLQVPADYVHTVDQTRHTSEHVVGNTTYVDRDVKTDDDLKGKFDNRVLRLVDGAITDREQRENKRANHRNFNRLLTLFGAVIIGLVVTWMATKGIIPAAVAPYTFVITVLLDSCFSLYALIKHY
jgi:hypothetical protein